MSRILIVLALLCAPAALAGSAADPGVGSSSILVGGTAPLSGEASAAGAVSRGAAAYFAYVNARGGVSGRKIDYKVLDDGYDPSRAVEAVRELVQQDHVFAVFNSLGTSTNLAVRDFLNQSKVPQLFVASGATTWGRDSRRHPWSIGYIPSYQTEGIALFQRVMRAAGANDLRNGYYVAGMASAFTLVDALRKAGKNPTRAGVMAAARSLNEANNPFVIPGIVVRTSAADGFPIQQVALERWTGTHWSIFTGPLTVAG